MAKKSPATAKSQYSFGPPLVLFLSALVVFFLGYLTKAYLFAEPDVHPKILVWAANEDVKPPQDLVDYLGAPEQQDDCKDYLGTDGVDGISLNAITEVVQDKYAKISYGCSEHLTGTPGAVAIKTGDKWEFFGGARYYVAATDDPAAGFEAPLELPRCTIVDKYQISKEFEPSCYDDAGKQPNKIKQSDLRTNDN
jgi:hypothetical protein